MHLAAEPSAGGLFNIGSGEAHTWIELATAVFRALDREPQIEFIEMPESLRGKYQYFTKAEIGKLRTTGYSQPVTVLSEAVGDYIRNYVIPGRSLGDES